MNKVTLLALIDALIEDKIAGQDLIPATRGKRGLKGSAGKDFIYEDHEENFKEILNNVFEKSKNSLKLKFNDLTEDEIDCLKLKFVDLSSNEIELLRGNRGPKGQKAKDFSFEEHRDDIAALILAHKNFLKLKFEDLTDEEKVSLMVKGHDGKDGTSFNFENEKEKINSIILDNQELFKLYFEDMTDEEKFSLKGPRGQKGKAGKSFNFEEEKDNLKNILVELFTNEKNNFKLKFDDLTEDEINTLKLKFDDLSEKEIFSLKGQNGVDGKDFLFEDEKENITEVLSSLDLKLKFEDLTDEEKLSLQGAKGLKGKAGKDFLFEDEKENITEVLSSLDLKLKFEDLTDDEVSSLKLTFDQLSSDEKFSLKGPRGQKGKAGKPFNFENEKEDIRKTILEEKDNLKLTFDDLTDDEKLSIRGRQGSPGSPGVMGLTGRQGSSGEDGLDAPFITSVEIETIGKEEFYFIFYFSNGTKIETDRIEMPSVEKIVQNFYSAAGGVGSDGGAQLEVFKDDVLVGITEQLNFEGDNISVAWDEENKKATVTVDEAPSSCIAVQDEGVTQTDCVNTFDFVGDGVEVLTQTTAGDWVLLSEVDPLTEEFTNPGFVRIKVPAPSKFVLEKEATIDISKLELVRLDTQTTATRANTNSYTNSKTIGMATANVTAGNSFEILVMGVVEDISFNFPINEPLFLQLDGTIGTTAVTASGQYLTRVGQSFGTGAIFINVDEPIGIA